MTSNEIRLFAERYKDKSRGEVYTEVWQKIGEVFPADKVCPAPIDIIADTINSKMRYPAIDKLPTPSLIFLLFLMDELQNSRELLGEY